MTDHNARPGHPDSNTRHTVTSPPNTADRRARYQWATSNPFERSDDRTSRLYDPDSPGISGSTNEATKLLSHESRHTHNTFSGSRERRSSIHESVLTVPSVRFRRNSLHETSSRSPGRFDGSVSGTRRSVAVGAVSTGRDPDALSHKFSLAGPEVAEAVTVNQPYVDPGYAHLNPAFDQPANVRPVWGLAKPLPRVLRPGMVPTVSEIKMLAAHKNKENEEQQQVDHELEEGRVEPSLQYDKVMPQLRNIRKERELSTAEAFGKSPLQAYLKEEMSSPAGVFSPRYKDTIPEEEEAIVDEADGNEDNVTVRQPSLAEQFPQLSEAIANLEEEKDNHLPYEDAIPLKAYEADLDEIHNLHTYWSVIRLRFREPLAELLAIIVQYVLGFSIDLAMTVSDGKAGVGDTGDWGWGLATMMAIYIAGGISGAHLNPAISIMLWIFRGFPLGKIPSYVTAQLLGAFLAALIAFGIFQPGILSLGEPNLAKSNTAGNWITFPRHDWVDNRTAFFTEFTATSILAITIMALGDNANAPPGAGMNAFIVGLVIVCLSMAFGWNTGLAMNPVRDFGPRLALLCLGYGKENLFTKDGYWFFVAWLGPISGAITGAFLYDAAIFVGGESPVNYPPKRIKRATKKWKKRMKARFERVRPRNKKLRDLKDDVAGYLLGDEGA